MKHTPGPLPSSCLTCRQRRKKCDKNRPVCERCLVGGFKCLGYDHIPTSNGPRQPKASTSKQATSSSLRAPSTRDPKNRLGSPRYNIYRNASDATTDSGTSEGDLSPKQPSSRRMQTTPTLSYRSAAFMPSPVSSHSSQTIAQLDYLSSSISLDSRSSCLAMAPRVVFGPPRPPVEETAPVELQQLPHESWAQPLFSLINTSGGIYNPSFVFNLPPTISPNPLLSGQIIEFILAQYEPLLEMVFFRPTREHLDLARDSIIVRLQESSLTHWSMYIGARIFQALAKDGKRADLRFLMSCVRRMDEHVCLESTRNGTLSGALHTLCGGLELVFLDYMTASTRSGYNLLKRLTPAFLRAAQTLPSYYPSQKVSLAEAFTAPHLEIGRFVFMDAVASLMFGVPPFIDYDTDTPFIRHGSDTNGYPGCIHPTEWIHGSPLELTSLIVKISLWRAKNPGVRCAPDEVWKPLEAEAWAWAPKVSSPISVNEPSQMVVRMAVQEGWRHAGLIYLYMGMCGCMSDDPRVQTSVRQIIQLLQILQPDLTTRTHYFIPVLVASICTPSEKHRAELRNAFVKTEKCMPWLFRALDYKHLVDHLWHGAAAGGKPVRWEDYIESRRATMPID
ncbi:unnamed protein product [Rhizoctonia solani]|uniref:Zn(2)-C6 fungal-type domain-containing protein n=3 Tax=Rhizoctonia solani TaxID=456999 RepID=A0A8H3A4N6_9AGAM|nr:fungal Zn(2)-cys(6) binuclear cluster domain protein [Rhizoctonia solani AG-3 Rhs1AP]KEP51864.1 fungal Zn(2)-cys(6) binuclear cluster domain protein [Rhizoctonia solani 123E]CAE6388994.1 unnamed protein product [Rhizoctonia solani]CAE6407181.1 unnamed protein product [Rhizoctonia solani]